MFGFRPEGRRIHDVDPIVAITPYLMPQRCDAQVFLSHDADYEPLMRYIAEKAREGHKITFMELLIASYVRGVSQVPETNRFIMNKQFYNRTELTVSFTLLMDTPDGSAEENAVKNVEIYNRIHGSLWMILGGVSMISLIVNYLTGAAHTGFTVLCGIVVMFVIHQITGKILRRA